MKDEPTRTESEGSLRRQEIRKLIVSDIMAGGFNESQAEAVVVMITTGKLRNVSINY